MSGDFTPEQKRYLEGFTSGLQIARTGRGLGGKPAASTPTSGKPPSRSPHKAARQ